MKMKKDTRHKTLQALCREYLGRARDLARRHGLDGIVDELIRSNQREECIATEEDVETLSRMANDERIRRTELPKMLGKSYRECVEDEDFESVKRLPRVGIYSNVSARLYSSELKAKKNSEKC